MMKKRRFFVAKFIIMAKNNQKKNFKHWGATLHPGNNNMPKRLIQRIFFVKKKGQNYQILKGKKKF
jgi:hypothetical protein